MLVVDRVELRLGHQAQQMGELQRDRARRAASTIVEPPDEVVEVGHVGQDVVADDQIGAACPPPPAGGPVSAPKKLDEGRDARAPRAASATLAAGSTPSDRDARRRRRTGGGSRRCWRSRSPWLSAPSPRRSAIETDVAPRRARARVSRTTRSRRSRRRCSRATRPRAPARASRRRRRARGAGRRARAGAGPRAADTSWPGATGPRSQERHRSERRAQARHWTWSVVMPPSDYQIFQGAWPDSHSSSRKFFSLQRVHAGPEAVVAISHELAGPRPGARRRRAPRWSRRRRCSRSLRRSGRRSHR